MPCALSHQLRPAEDLREAERRTRVVIGITAVTMVGEIVTGWLYNSMALLADGWHMASHAGALGITVCAYAYARRHRDDPRFSYGTGKVGVLGGYTNAVILAIVAIAMAFTSLERLLTPQPIGFNEALAVASLGLGINLICVWLLSSRSEGHIHSEQHRCSHSHGNHSSGGASETRNHHSHPDIPSPPSHAHPVAKTDHNLQAAVLHVATDALTSVLAILALLAGKWLNWIWLDPLMGVVGAVVIVRWSWSLLGDTAHILLDGQEHQARMDDVRHSLEDGGDGRVVDLHLWRLSPRHVGAVVALVSHDPQSADHYKEKLSKIPELSHVTVEVNPCQCVRGGECQIESRHLPP